MCSILLRQFFSKVLQFTIVKEVILGQQGNLKFRIGGLCPRRSKHLPLSLGVKCGCCSLVLPAPQKTWVEV